MGADDTRAIFPAEGIDELCNDLKDEIEGISECLLQNSTSQVGHKRQSHLI